MLKASENPPLSYPCEVSPIDIPGTWWVAHTKSRNEKALAHDLIARDVPYFLPMTWNVRRHRQRTIRTLLPLFTGYIFFCGDDDKRVDVLRTNRVANIIDVMDQQFLVSELTQIEAALRMGAPLIPHDYIKTGQWCRVKAGPLMGIEGIVQEVRQVTRLVLQVNILGQAASMEVDIDMIEPIDEPTYNPDATPPPDFSDRN